MKQVGKNHKLESADRAVAALERIRQSDGVTVFGDHIAGLLPWNWFITITFRDTRPSFPVPLPVFCRRSIARLGTFMEDLESAAGQPIGWLYTDGLGEIGGRFHLHGLVAGVAHLDCKVWTRAACKRFGSTVIDVYRPEAGADHYIAKHFIAGGELHPGGQLLHEKLLNAPKPSLPAPGRIVVAHSADVSSSFFKQNLKRRRR